MLRALGDPAERSALVNESVAAALPVFDAVLREHAYQRNQEFTRSLDPAGHEGHGAAVHPSWPAHVRALDAELVGRAAATFPRLAAEEILCRGEVIDPTVAAVARERRRARSEQVSGRTAAGHHGPRAEPPKAFEPLPALDGPLQSLAEKFTPRIMLWRNGPADLTAELDRSVPMPGWTNIWTMPIQNRVDMLATGVNTAVGVRVLGRRLNDVVEASEAIAEAVKRVPGAVDVVADPIRGKGYLEIIPDRDKAARLGVRVADINEAVETALAGATATTVVAGRERHPARVRYARDFRGDEEAVKKVLVRSFGKGDFAGPPRQVALGRVADVRITDGPATIKGENGLLRNYVRFNVRGRSAAEVVADARRAVAERVHLPADVHAEWTGQFEHEERARRTLAVILPLVVGLIFLVLYWTYRDWADATLILIAVPGAVAGGVFFQWLLGFTFSVTVWVGYIACFGMATSTGIIMLVYLREAVAKAGGLEGMTPADLRRAVMDGAVHRLRPKLLTEGTTIIGLAPMLWATGVGSEVIKPMAAPVLGGLLVSDEVIDLLLPVLFHWVRRRRLERMNARREAPGPRPQEIVPTSGPVASQV